LRAVRGRLHYDKKLKQSLGTIGWKLSAGQIAKLDAVTEKTPPYPYWHQRDFANRNATNGKYELMSSRLSGH
jgi:hypothetical protein